MCKHCFIVIRWQFHHYLSYNKWMKNNNSWPSFTSRCLFIFWCGICLFGRVIMSVKPAYASLCAGFKGSGNHGQLGLLSVACIVKLGMSTSLTCSRVTFSASRCQQNLDFLPGFHPPLSLIVHHFGHKWFESSEEYYNAEHVESVKSCVHQVLLDVALVGLFILFTMQRKNLTDLAVEQHSAYQVRKNKKTTKNTTVTFSKRATVQTCFPQPWDKNWGYLMISASTRS